MKETFKAIQFNRKQRLAFVVVLCLILVGSIINIIGFSSDKKKMEDRISLDDVITQKYYYKKYYKSKYKNSSTFSKKASTSSKKSQSKDSETNQWDKQNHSKSKYLAIDTFTQVEVPDDYTHDSTTIKSIKEEVINTTAMSSFDPNVATKDDLMLMYLPEKWIDNVIAYRTKGGVYRSKDDLKKLYTTTSALYVDIEDYVVIDEATIAQLLEKQLSDQQAANEAWLEELVASSNLIDINAANEETLTKLPMVTPSLAKTISNYKNKLGGYHQIEQLQQVYGLDKSIYEKILPYLTCEPIIEHVNVNAKDVNKLNKHPYIGYKKTKIILRYRKQHGLFQSIDQVQKVGVWNKEEFELLKPYLAVQD